MTCCVFHCWHSKDNSVEPAEAEVSYRLSQPTFFGIISLSFFFLTIPLANNRLSSLKGSFLLVHLKKMVLSVIFPVPWQKFLLIPMYKKESFTGVYSFRGFNVWMGGAIVLDLAVRQTTMTGAMGSNQVGNLMTACREQRKSEEGPNHPSRASS